MTIIGTEEEISKLKNQCDGRCVDGEWCVFGEWCIFGFQKDGCPVDSDGGCMAFENIRAKDGTYFSVLNER